MGRCRLLPFVVLAACVGGYALSAHAGPPDATPTPERAAEPAAQPVNPYASQGQSALQSPQASADAAALYMQRCAACHDHPRERIPPRMSLAVLRSQEDVYRTLSSGVMKQQAIGLTADQMRGLAIWVTGKKFGTSPPDPPADANMCSERTGHIDLGDTQWNGWGRDYDNSRYQPRPGLSAAEVPRLKLKWTFALPGQAVYAQPVVVGDYAFISGAAGWVFALNAHTGCTYWAMDAGARVRSAITVAPLPGARDKFAVYFNNEVGEVFALDALSGAKLWARRVEDHPMARLVGTLRFHDGRLYVPISSIEEVTAADPKYPCCSFRGGIVAVDARTGELLWRTHTIEEPVVQTKVNSSGTQMYGPAGGAIWGSPTIDLKRKLLYVGTGDSYTDERTDGTNALLAIDMATGKRVWSRQLISDDAWIVGCEERSTGNCPSPLGPDHDFAAAPILRTLPNGRQILLGAAKSGVVYGFDPQDKGKILWQQKIARGGEQGGVLWGPAADRNAVYAAVSDYNIRDRRQGGGLFALKITDGEILWKTPAPISECPGSPPYCSPAQVSAVTAMPGIVFAGSVDGHIRAYDSKGGKIVWDYDTYRVFDAVNGAKAHGGSIDSGGQSIVDGRLYVMSGSTRLPGNALLMFTVDGR
jgi:polyvinyl alcohol dehydrogenase (cytochrome)